MCGRGGGIAPAIAGGGIREDGEDLRLLGRQVINLGEQLSLLAQSYRDLYERMRVILQRPGGAAAPADAPSLPASGRSPRTRRSPPSGPAVQDWTSLALSPGDTIWVRRNLRGLLEQQGELGRQLVQLSRHRLFLAGGEEPRRILSRLSELGDRCQSLRLSSDAMVRGSSAFVSTVLDDLCQLNSGAAEDLLRFGHDLRSRGDGILAGHREDRRYLQGEAWRRTVA